MTVHTKLIMNVSLRNKGERHVQPQQGPKLIPQPQSRRSAQHADGQTCRRTCAASGENVCILIALHSFVPIFRSHARTHAHKHTFNFLNTALARIAQRPSLDRSVRTSARRVNTVVFAFAEEVKDLTDPRVCQYDHNLGVVYVL